MDILVIGGGGREHAVIKTLKKSKNCGKIWCLPGNGGIAADAECVSIKATDIEGIVSFAKEKRPDFAVVTPDDPLCMGLVDRLEEIGVPCFGPTANAAVIEGSKVFSKNLMKKYGIPTADSRTFTDADEALAYLKSSPYPAVVKADGLALGKGALIVNSYEEAEKAVRDMMVDKIFGESGSRILVEEFLTGPEVSVLSFTDGKTVVPMVSSMDHKRAKTGDEGLNTGGMGTVAPNPYYTEEIAARCMREIFLPTINAMNAEGRTFKGCLYFGLMLTPDGPKVIEYNCRFGDPETQVVLPLLESDLLEIMQACREGTLSETEVKFSSGAACCVVLASDGYPQSYRTGYEISLPETKEGENIFIAGAKCADGKLLTAGGRVLGATATAPTLKEAVRRAYALADKIHFENAYKRADIGARALKASEGRVFRIYVEKKDGFDQEARTLLADCREILGIGAERVRVLNRYDAEDIEKALFDECVRTVFSEPQMDVATEDVDLSGSRAFAVEYLPGQFDQRADSAAQCIQLISQGERPLVRTAKIYAIYGDITEGELDAIKRYVINPVESREADFAKPETLKIAHPAAADVETLHGFSELDKEGLAEFVKKYSLAMDEDDVAFCQGYFRTEGRDPTLTEIRMIDTYWSDHCRHTTFLTTIDGVTFEDELLQNAYKEYLAAREEIGRKKPVNLMDVGTIAAKLLKKRGLLQKLDESEEINACTVKIKVTIDGNEEDWLLLFKNETHNHPTEIEPFGGAATCIGGAIRDPLSGRSYVYAAMRVTGAADPLLPVKDTMKGKLPQRKLVTTAAAGYSSYGNQIGLATGQVDELYHPGYVAKRLEIGAVIAATPQKNVRREVPEPGDKVILLGGRTGRDGCGGATGSSKSHTLESLTRCGAEVQKGNAPEERKLQRLFRNPEASILIKRCNDFGAGGVSVAIGELADGLDIDLDLVPKKYDGLDGTELAISESQERMAVVVSPADEKRFIELANAENLEATTVAKVTREPRLVMKWRGKTIVDVSREFLNSNGAEKHTTAHVARASSVEKEIPADFAEGYRALAGDLNICSKRGLSERFDSTIGAGTVLMPFGGKYQLTPPQAMVHLISVEKGRADARAKGCGVTDDVSFMSWGANPYIAEKNPYLGAYLAVVESVSKLIATGASFEDVYLTFQEYFLRLGHDPNRWGIPLAALLGAFKAQKELGVAAIGGKDSMSGTFEHIDVPPTFVSFAVTTGKVSDVVSPEFKGAGHKVILLKPETDKNGLPVTHSLLGTYELVTRLMRENKVYAAFTPVCGGIAEGVLKSCLGNRVGFAYADGVSMSEIFSYRYGAFVLEVDGDVNAGMVLGETIGTPAISYMGASISLAELQAVYENKLEPVYACNIPAPARKVQNETYEGRSGASPAVKTARPKVLIPVFPGTNCEYDTAKAFLQAGAEPEVFVIRNRTSEEVSRSAEEFASLVKKSNIVFIPGGFSGGDEPDGSGKFITAFFRGAAVKEAVTELLERRDGLMGGICNGFQALIKLGLVPYGKIIDTDETCPTLTYNDIGRHQSRIVRVRVSSVKSPWLAGVKAGDTYSVPISHGEGRFVASDALLRQLAENGQIMTQYVDLAGNATMDIRFNPNGSADAVEGILSPDGRVFGKMGHSERKGAGLYLNVPGDYDMKLFESAVKYFK